MSDARKTLKRILLLASTLTVGAASGWLTHSYATRASCDRPVAVVETPDELLRQALTLTADEEEQDSNARSVLATSGTMRRAELLKAAALRRLRSEPRAIRKAWQTLNNALPSVGKDDGNLEKSVGELSAAMYDLLAFQEVLNDALQQVSTGLELDECLEIDQATGREIDRLRKALTRLLKDLAPKFKDESETDGPIGAIREFAVFSTRYEPAFLLLVASMPDSGVDETLADILDLENKLYQHTQPALKRIEAEVAAYREKLKDGPPGPIMSANGKHAESAEFGPGKCELFLLDVAEISRALAEADLDSWRKLKRVAHTTSSAPESDPQRQVNERSGTSLEESLETLALELRRLQLQAYNLWALGELEAAETVETWDERLAVVDPGFLEPAVSAIYSSVYGRRIEELKDASHRSRVVQRLLSAQRTPLSAF